MNAYLAVVRNEALQLYRDPFALLLMLVGGLGTLVVLAYTLSADIAGITTLVVDLDRQRQSRQFIQTLANDELFAPHLVDNRTMAEQALQEGWAKLAVIIPPGYSRDLLRGEPVRIQILIDGSEPAIAETVANHLQALAGAISSRPEPATRPNPLSYRARIRYNADLTTIVSVMPGLMAMVLVVPAVGAASAFARERERGNFELVISTPLGRWPLLLGRVTPYLGIGLLNITLFVALACYGFRVPLRGSLTLFLGLGLLYIFATLSAGVFIAQFLNTQHTAMISTFMLFGITPVYLSDVFFPLVSMPAWLQRQAAVLPATHFVIIARGIFLKGIGWEILWPNVLVLSAIGLVMSGLSYLRLQKRLG